MTRQTLSSLLHFLALSVVGLAAPEKMQVDGVTYRVLRVAPAAVDLVWADARGEPLRTFPRAARHLEAADRPPLALMNGGIFEPGGIPSGLLVRGGREIRPVNRRAGKGNFYLQPNGVFWIGRSGAAVVATAEWPPAGAEVRCAVQSGPLLLRRGKVHPRFNADSTSRLIRNGVGVSKLGEVVLAITDFHSPKLPNLHEFALLFRHLGCDDALFLDGDLSQMRLGADLKRPSNAFGSIIAVFEIEPEK